MLPGGRAARDRPPLCDPLLPDDASIVTSWQPILSGPLADEARAGVEALGRCLRRPSADEPLDPFLANGCAGLALFYAYYALDRETAGESAAAEEHAETALEFLSQAMEGFSTRSSASLYDGLLGPPWVVEHLKGRLLDADEEDANEDVDVFLTEILAESPRRQLQNFDLMQGIVGAGVYALERLPRPAAVEILERVVQELVARAVEVDGGVTWWTDPELLSPEAQAEVPRGCYNLGVPHGQPGMIAFLALADAAGVTGATRAFLDRAVAYLLQARIPGTADFPSWLEPGGAARSVARSAWCYGNPGIAATLRVAARAVGEAAWERLAVELALGSAARPIEQTGVRDASLCHGSAGLGHQYNRLYQATGEERLADAARYWFRRALDDRQEGESVAGFLTLGYRSDGQVDMVESPGFLSGAAGIGLTLLAAVSPVAPDWDRVLLISS